VQRRRDSAGARRCRAELFVRRRWRRCARRVSPCMPTTR
jgi:hypothetical protein